VLSARRLLSACCLAAIVAVGALPLGPLPPLGRLLDPVYGIWGVARTAELPGSARGHIPGLTANVDVRYDSRGVPHIFASSETDAYRALGYVVARDRLFQIELQARAGAGTLTELVGPAAVALDRRTRQLGLPRAAEAAFHKLDSASALARTLRAYGDGVNAWIAEMGPGDLPIEYRLLNRRPTPWTSVDAYYLLGRMSFTLASSDPGLDRLRAAAVVGDTVAGVLLPEHSPLQQPIVPTAYRDAHFLRARFPPLAPLRAIADSTLADALGEGAFDESPTARGLGSNNWAVSPRRTRSGFALLAGDPHLELTLPAIWYEVHLVVPGQLDVAGVTITGGPGVIIGFTRDVAWTFTNTGADVLDLYAETVDDSARPLRYRVDGSWQPLTVEVEHYRDPHGDLVATDTLLATHRGPMRRVAGRWLSMRWTALESGAALPALLQGPHATSTAEWLRALATYDVPALNMLVADRSGSIAIRSTGTFPLRPGDGRGDVVRDGSASTSDWRGVLPLDQYPTAIDPSQGFLASANQEPIDPSAIAADRGVYFGADWPPPWRAININTLLRGDSAVTPDDMRRWQTDPKSSRADFFLPFFLSAAHREDSAGRGTAALREAARLLSEWTGRYTRSNERAVLFEAALHEMTRRVSDAIVTLPPQWRRRSVVSGMVLAELLHDSTSAWWPALGSRAGVGSRDAMLAASLTAAYDSTVKRYGPPTAGGWRWDRVQHANIYHLLHIPAFSRLDLPMQGGPETLNPSAGAGTEGASWRMVVQLGPEVHGWAVYPGGQSGNPVSSRYADRLPLWLAGSLDPVRFPRRPTDLAQADIKAVLTLEPR
jgi:penicillin amidase